MDILTLKDLAHKHNMSIPLVRYFIKRDEIKPIDRVGTADIYDSIALADWMPKLKINKRRVK